MKLMTLLVLAILSFNHAEACIGEAQIIAEIQGIQPMDPDACFVAINPMAITLYRENISCPLDLSEVLQSGIQVGMRSEHACKFHPGDTISGVIVKSQDGQLTLE